ncbi:MAG TPA: response regulator transcription factor, partial [Anaerolineales bacterium]|nr:response regulator transcription factor [Anaerolineales bacterium]
MADKIRVLIVDDIAETRENVRKLLQFEADIEVVGTARTGKEGIQIAQELNPDVVLMDINMPDIDGITATEQIRQYSTHIQVVILSVQGDQNYMRRAMLAGARDFLTKPPMGDELISAVKRAGEMAHSEREKGAKHQLSLSASNGVLSIGGFPTATQGKIILVYSQNQKYFLEKKN